MTDSWSAHVRPFHLFHDNLYRISFLSNFLSSCFRHHSKIITRLGFTLITWSRRAATWAERSVYTCHPDAPRNDSPSSSLPLALRKSGRKCTGNSKAVILFGNINSYLLQSEIFRFHSIIQFLHRDGTMLWSWFFGGVKEHQVLL